MDFFTKYGEKFRPTRCHSLDVTASKSHAFGPAFRKQVKTFKPLCLKKLGDSRLSGPIS